MKKRGQLRRPMSRSQVFKTWIEMQSHHLSRDHVEEMLSGINLKFNSLVNPLNLRVFESEFRQVLILNASVKCGAKVITPV